jgi:hypothetical protein
MALRLVYGSAKSLRRPYASTPNSPALGKRIGGFEAITYEEVSCGPPDDRFGPSSAHPIASFGETCQRLADVQISHQCARIALELSAPADRSPEVK